MLYARINVAAERKKTDWTNLQDPKVMEKYKADFSASGIEDSTGQIQTDPQFNRLLQTPEYIKNLYNGWLADFDGSNTDIIIDQNLFADAMEVKEIDPTKVIRDNPKKQEDGLSPYKLAAIQIGDRMNVLVKLRKSAYDEAATIDYLSEMTTKRAKFVEKYFGVDELKRRTKHYNELKNTYYNYVVPEIEKRGQDLINKLIICFTKISELGKTLYDSNTFSYAYKKGNEFIRNLKNIKNVTNAYNYLYSSILAGDGQAKISNETKSRLRKTAKVRDLNSIERLNIKIDFWMKKMGYNK